MEVHSERESYRRVIELRTPEEQAASVIVMRRTSSVWVTFDGAIKTTVIMNDPQASQFIDAVAAARTPR